MEREDIDIKAYGCSAHLFNFFAKDLEIASIKEQVVQVIGYFHNQHLAAAYMNAAGLHLMMPQEIY